MFTDSWSRESLRAMIGGDTAGRISYVACERDHVVGYIFAQLIPPEGEILNVAVDPAYRRKGIGSRLIETLLGDLRGRCVETVFLEVRKSNTAARATYRSLGFQAVGQRAGYYRNPPEDAEIMALRLV